MNYYVTKTQETMHKAHMNWDIRSTELREKCNTCQLSLITPFLIAFLQKIQGYMKVL